MKSTKLTVLLAATLFCAAATYAQQNIMADKVPQEVQSAFRAKFPDASDVKWVMEPNTNYEAKFKLATSDERAEFNASGTWVETESPITRASLPNDVTRAVMTRNPSCKISEAEEVQTANRGRLYEVACGTGTGKAEYRVTAEGKLETAPLKK